MPQTRIMLNTRKPGNDGFYDPVSGLHVTKASPVGTISRVSPQVLLELKDLPMPGLLDLDHKIDIVAGTWKESVIAAEKAEAEKEDAGQIVNVVDASGTPNVEDGKVQIPVEDGAKNGEEDTGVHDGDAKVNAENNETGSNDENATGTENTEGEKVEAEGSKKKSGKK